MLSLEALQLNLKKPKLTLSKENSLTPRMFFQNNVCSPVKIIIWPPLIELSFK